MSVEYKYSDLIEVNKEFQEVFNEDVDKAYKTIWKTFIPNESFISLLDVTLKALSRERSGDAKSIWLYGSYGTGKTHAVFVIKHLLEDDDEEVESYLRMFSNFFTSSIVERIKALRKQGVLVVFRSTAGHLNTPIKLLMEIQQSIYNSYNYRMRGRNYKTTKTEIQLLLDKLKSETINWEKLIEKNQSKLYDVSSKEEIKRRLEGSDVEFASRFLDVLIEEGINPIATTEVDKLKEWIEEILSQGDISKILFIWDEFSDFFRSEAPLATLQEIAHLTQRIPFYLLLVTHRDPEHWSDLISKEVGKLKDRFHRVAYRMEPITVYKLVSHLIRPKDNSWNSIVEDIWSIGSKNGIEEEIRKIENHAYNTSINDLKSIIPIHPYTGYIASRIAEYFGSANRTLFKFLKDQDCFLKFLEEYPKEKYFFLTADFLWDFFFIKNEQELLNTPGIAPLLSYWRDNEEKMSEEEIRIFRTLMVLFALREKIPELGLLKPSLSVLKIAFSGSPIYNNLKQILSLLEDKKAVRLMNTTNDVEILKPAYGFDSEELEKIRKNLPKFKDIINDEKIVDFEDFQLHPRVRIFKASAEEILKKSLPKIDVKPHEIPVIFILMERIIRLTDLIENTKSLSKDNRGVIFLLSKVEFGDDWEKLKDNLAYFKYYMDVAKKYEDAKYYEKQIINIVSKWKEKIKWGEFQIFASFESEELEQQLIGIEIVKKFFERKVVDILFPYSLEIYVRKEPLWKNTSLNSRAIEVGLDLKKVKEKKYSALKPFVDFFVEKDMIIDEEGNFIESEVQAKKNHPLLKMREKVRTIYEEKENVLDTSEVWKKLQGPPFGLYECPVGCFAFAVLMREYCRGFYAVDINGVEKELNYDNMAEILKDVIKGKGSWKIQTISKEEREFCQFLNDALNLDEKSPRDAIINLREKIKNEFKYPIWSLKHISWEKEQIIRKDVREALEIIIDLLDKVVKLPIKESGRDNSYKEYIKEFSKELEMLNEPEKKLILKFFKQSAEKFRKGFENFMDLNFHSKMSSQVSFDIVDKVLRERLQEEPCFWREEKVADYLQKMVSESKLMKKIGSAFGMECYFLDDLRSNFIEKVKDGSLLPLWVYEERYELSIFLKKLEEILFGDVKPFELDFTKLNELFYGFENYSQVFQNVETSLKEWIEKNFEELEEPIFEELKLEFWKLISEKPKISKKEVIEKLKIELSKIEVRIIKQKILEKLKNLTGYESFAEFLNSKMIPHAIIKYLPEFEKSTLKNPDSIINDLLNLKKLMKEDLKSVLEYIENNEKIFESLAEKDVNKKLLKIFLGNEWYEELFTESDLQDLFNYLTGNLGSVDRWSEKMIREVFEEWRLNKYKDVFYSRVQEILDRYDPENLREFVKKLIEDPIIGFKFIREIYEKG